MCPEHLQKITLKPCCFIQLHTVVRTAATRFAPRSTSYCRVFSTSGACDSGDGSDLTAGEKYLIDKINKEFPDATHVEVSDVSGR